MAVVIDATIGGEFANSYVDVAYADDYFLDHYDTTKLSTWDALGDSQKQILLVSACRVLDTARFTNHIQASAYELFYDRTTGTVRPLTEREEPVPYYSYQALQFPRNLDVKTTDGSLYIPEPVKIAQCEQAIYLAGFDETAIANRLKGIVNDTVAVGRGQIHLNQQYVGEGSAFAPLALELVRPFLLRSGTRLRRG